MAININEKLMSYFSQNNLSCCTRAIYNVFETLFPTTNDVY